MKLTPSPDGGLRLDVEDKSDWQLLLGILHDAQGSGFDLATQVGGKMDQAADWHDWVDYVIPDLREGFLAHLKTLLLAIESARLEAAGGPGCVRIPREDAFHWYGALNQARFALEAIHHFGPGDAIDPGSLSQASLHAFIRCGFYSAIQNSLLDHGLE